MTPKEITELTDDKLLDAILYYTVDQTEQQEYWHESDLLVALRLEALRRMNKEDATKGHTMNATHKRPKSFKLSAPTIRKLADLAAHYEVSATVLIEMLVAERHATVYGTVEAPRKP